MKISNRHGARVVCTAGKTLATAAVALAMVPYCIPAVAFADAADPAEQCAQQDAVASEVAPPASTTAAPTPPAVTSDDAGDSVLAPDDACAATGEAAALPETVLVAQNGAVYTQESLAGIERVVVPEKCSVTFQNVTLHATEGPALKVLGEQVTLCIEGTCVFCSATGAGVEVPEGVKAIVSPVGEGARLEMTGTDDGVSELFANSDDAEFVCEVVALGIVSEETTAAQADGTSEAALSLADTTSSNRKSFSVLAAMAKSSVPDDTPLASGDEKIDDDDTPLASDDSETITIDDGQGEGTTEIDVSNSPTGDVTEDAEEESNDEEDGVVDEDTEVVTVNDAAGDEDEGDADDEDDDEDADDEDDSVETGDIALIGLGCVAGVAAIAGIGAMVARRKDDDTDAE